MLEKMFNGVSNLTTEAIKGVNNLPVVNTGTEVLVGEPIYQLVPEGTLDNSLTDVVKTSVWDNPYVKYGSIAAGVGLGAFAAYKIYKHFKGSTVDADLVEDDEE